MDGGTENGLIHVVTPNLCNWHCSNLFELATMSLGSYMYHNGCISKSNVACRDTSLSDNITVRKWGFPYYWIPWTHPLLLSIYSYSTIHDGGHTYYCQGRLLLKL